MVVLVAVLAVAVAACAVALGARDRLSVPGGLEGAEAASSSDLVVVARPRATVPAAVTRQAEEVITTGLLADPDVVAADPVAVSEESELSVVAVTLGDLSAGERREAAQRIAADIDPGPLQIVVGGEALVQEAAAEEVEEEFPRLALLILPLVLLVLVLAFGVRHAAAPALAGVTAAAGGIAIVRLLPETLELPAAAVAVAAAVGLALGVEATLTMRREAGLVRSHTLESGLAETLRRATPRIALAGLGAALGAFALLAIPLPAARSAALGGAAAALLAPPSGLLAMAAVLVLTPPEATSAGVRGSLGRLGDRVRGGRAGDIADAIAIRPWLAWIPALLALGVLVLGASQAFDSSATRLAAADIPGKSESATAAELLGEELGPAATERLASGSREDAAEAGRLYRERLPWILGGLTLLGLLAAWAATVSWRLAFARGIAVALPAAATCGLLVLAGEGRLPLDPELGGRAPHASALFATLGAVGAVSLARAVFGDLAAALAGTLVAGCVLGVLAGTQIDGVAQVGAGIATGLLIDLVLVRAVLSPTLEQALPKGPIRRPRLPRPRLPNLPRPRIPRPRLPDRLRR